MGKSWGPNFLLRENSKYKEPKAGKKKGRMSKEAVREFKISGH